MFILSGFGDEIAEDFETQLVELRKMDVNHVALRNLWGTNILKLSEEQKVRARAQLRKHGMGVSEIGSPLGKVRIDGDWAEEWARYERALEMASFFDCPRIRIFSYYFPEGDPIEKHRAEVVRRLREMAARAERDGAILIHENEENIYGADGIHLLDLIRAVNSPAFKAVFDPSNYVTIGTRPFDQWWAMLAEHVVHFHVKDKKASGEQVPAGEGDGQFREILASMAERGYVGFATMEPHLAQAGQFTGFSGPGLFAHAVERFRALCDEAGMRHRQTRVAVVGMGFIGGFHCKAFESVPEAKLVAVADTIESPGLLEARESWNVEAYTDLDALLAREDLHAITIGTPSGLHGEIALKALRAGKHVLTEKPLEVTLAKADEMIREAGERGLRLGVVSQHRTDPGILELREAVASGALGRVVLAQAFVPWHRTQQYYDGGGWRGTWKLDGGGALMNQGVHTVDMLQWVVGAPVRRVVGQTATATHERIEVEDVAQALLEFEGGAMGLIVATTSAYPGFAERLEVVGTKGTIVVEKDKVVLREIQGEEKLERTDSGEEFGVGASDPKAISNRGHVMQLADFCRATRDDRAPMIPGEEGRKPLEIILAVYESAKRGAWVTLPLE